MGMEFLHSTNSFTLNKHIHVPVDDAFEATVINNQRRRLRCHLDSYWCIIPAEEAFKANANTGSQVDLISRALCQAQGFDILPVTADESVVKFAHGNTGDIFGKVHPFEAMLNACSKYLSNFLRFERFNLRYSDWGRSTLQERCISDISSFDF